MINQHNVKKNKKDLYELIGRDLLSIMLRGGKEHIASKVKYIKCAALGKKDGESKYTCFSKGDKRKEN